jgi:WhiB family redox-sensing transcriptional regulator
MTNPTWMENAACKGNQEPFFDEIHMTIVREARKICAGCSVKMQCLDHAIKNKEVGVWAGTTTNERARIIRSLRKESAEIQLTAAFL